MSTWKTQIKYQFYFGLSTPSIFPPPFSSLFTFGGGGTNGKQSLKGLSQLLIWMISICTWLEGVKYDIFTNSHVNQAKRYIHVKLKNKQKYVCFSFAEVLFVSFSVYSRKFTRAT